MFTLDSKITEKDLKGKNIYKVLLSMNNHQVATPETSLEEARSYVFIFREGRNRLSAYIALHLLVTDRKLIYQHSANPFLEKELLEVEGEARDFAEYMGAMMDVVDFAGMSDLDQDSWIENQDIFSTKTHPEAVPAEQPPQQSTAEVAPAPEPAAVPSQPAPETEAISASEPPQAPVPPLPKSTPAAEKVQLRAVPEEETVKMDMDAQAPPPAATRRRGDAAQEKETAGINTPPRQPAKKICYSATSVVSRDREALARLLTSF